MIQLSPDTDKQHQKRVNKHDKTVTWEINTLNTGNILNNKKSLFMIYLFQYRNFTNTSRR